MRLDQPFQWRQSRPRTGPLSNTLNVQADTSLPSVMTLPKKNSPLSDAAAGVGTAVAGKAVDNAIDAVYSSSPSAADMAGAIATEGAGEVASAAGSQAAMLAEQTAGMGSDAVGMTAEAAGNTASMMGPLGAAMSGVMEGNYGKAAGAAAGSVAGNAVLPGIGGIIGGKLGGLFGGSLGFEKGTKEVKEAPLGTGMAEEARKKLKGRKEQLDELERKAMGYQSGTSAVGAK